jgi:hypothetical protein
VDPLGTLLNKLFGLFDGVFLVINLAMIVTLYEADALAAAKVDSRYDIHYFVLQRVKRVLMRDFRKKGKALQDNSCDVAMAFDKLMAGKTRFSQNKYLRGHGLAFYISRFWKSKGRLFIQQCLSEFEHCIVAGFRDSNGGNKEIGDESLDSADVAVWS